MGHVFVSYASADRERARQIAALVASEGWDVWWDRTIPPGRQFDEVIEEALDAATCVVVLWSKASIASTWVKTEAAEANRRKLLIPVVIEDVKIPLEFRRLQAADLTGWNGERAQPEVDKFIAAIEREIGRPGGSPARPATIRSTVAASSYAASPATVPATAQPERAPTLRDSGTERAPIAGASRQSAGLKWVVAGVLLVLLVGGFAWYQSEQRAQQQQMQAEQQRRELERKLEEGQRLAAAERERQAKDAADQAERERAARELLAKEKAAREAAEREAARRQAADAAAAQTRSRLAEEAARRPVETSPARSLLPAPQASAPQASAPLASVSSGLTWRDHALIYSGTLVLDNTGATLRAAITDLKNGRRIGGYSVPARISLRNPERGEYFVQAEFDIPGDSTTPSPHTHQVGLIVRRQSDGTLKMVQNCPQPGNCF